MSKYTIRAYQRVTQWESATLEVEAATPEEAAKEAARRCNVGDRVSWSADQIEADGAVEVEVYDEKGWAGNTPLFKLVDREEEETT